MATLLGICTALGTIALAAVGCLSFRQNQSLIKASIDEASASNLLVVEAQNDRELRWRPVTSARWKGSVVGPGGPGVHIELVNAGGGPAISCRLVLKGMGNDGWLSAAVDISPNSSMELEASQILDSTTSSALSTWKGDDGFNHNAESLGAIFAKDVLGFRYRWLIVKDGSDRCIIERVERWRPGERPEPSWARYHLIWPDYGRAPSDPQIDGVTSARLSGES